MSLPGQIGKNISQDARGVFHWNTAFISMLIIWCGSESYSENIQISWLCFLRYAHANYYVFVYMTWNAHTRFANLR